MVLNRRPARFISRPDSMKTKEISQDQFELLRAAAARVYINEQNPADKSSEVDKAAANEYANVKAEASLENMQILALAATQIGAAKGKKKGSNKKKQ